MQENPDIDRDRNVENTRRHGYIVLNSLKPDDELKGIDYKTDFQLQRVNSDRHHVLEPLRGRMIMVRAQVMNGKFKDYYIGEEFHGRPHPYLLIPPTDITIGE